jgi:hypothetical protein
MGLSISGNLFLLLNLHRIAAAGTSLYSSPISRWSVPLDGFGRFRILADLSQSESLVAGSHFGSESVFPSCLIFLRRFCPLRLADHMDYSRVGFFAAVRFVLDRRGCHFVLGLLFVGSFGSIDGFLVILFHRRSLSLFEVAVEMNVSERFLAEELHFELVPALGALASVFR